MSRDADAKTDPKAVRLYDKRIVERNIKKGLLSRKDYDKHLKALEDIADKGVYGGPLEDDDDLDDRDDLDVADDEGMAVAPAPATAANDVAEEAEEDEADDDEDDDLGPGVPPDGNSHGT